MVSKIAFCVAVYPLILMGKQDPALAMMIVIAFTAWSSFAHATVVGVQAFFNLIARRELVGAATFIVIGVTQIALAPAKQPVERASAVLA